MTARWLSRETGKTGRKEEEKKENPGKFGLRCQNKSSATYNEFSQQMLLRSKRDSQALGSCL